MTKKGREEARQARGEPVAKLPPNVPPHVREALSHVGTVLTDEDADMRATSLILLVGMVADAGERERADLSFYAGAFALLHLGDGRKQLGKILTALNARARKRKRPPRAP